MWQRKNNWQLLISVLAAAYALMSKTSLSIIILTVVMVGIWLLNNLEQREHIEVIESSAERKRGEALVRVDEAFEKLEALIKAIPSALGYINQKGEFDVTNQMFEHLIEPKHKSVFDASIDVPIRKVLLDAFLGEKQFIRQINYRGTDYQILSIPFFNEKERYNGCMVIFQDVTRVVDGEKVQKQFIDDASHELRTPITAIKGMIEILNRPGFDDDATRVEFLKQIEKENNRLDKIVEDLLLQSRLKANQVHLEKTFFNLKPFIEGVVYDKRIELQRANIVVNIECSDTLQVYADQFRMNQVLVNLINNAINYSKDGNIWVVCRKHDGKTIIEFSDDGQGMSADLVPHVFERFVRGDASRARDSGGSGLGLAISKSILEAHDGSISVESVLGEGTKFTLVL